MNKGLSFFALILSLSQVFGQSAADMAVRLSATVQTNPAQISLSWPSNTTTTQYQVFRKLKNATAWGAPLSALSGTINQYTDNSVALGSNYEYRVIRVGSGYTGYGYINSGIEVPATEYRGKLILVVDSAFITPLASEIARLITDIEGDGWTVMRLNVNRNAPVDSVKSQIKSLYFTDPVNTKAVFLLGRIPVPYSGNINPDGHPDHLGAWPADVYYGDMDGIWTDVTVNSTAATSNRHHNIPGDGKFDQSLVPGNIELQVGRVDFYNLPAFTLNEVQLLKNYLDKNHDYRKKIYVPLARAVIDDNFGYFGGEGFAASAHKNFAPLVGTSSVVAADYFTSMNAGSYLWSYGCGGGSYTSAGGIGNTAGLSTASLQGVFTMLFGSYFGDWDSQNNFLRAPLAQGKILTNLWSGRPHYQVHHMGLGENIGYGLLLTQNNPGNLYFASPTGITGKWIHNALMGDPTLRNSIVAPASNVIATKNGNHCTIVWSHSADSSVLGYHLYVRNDSVPEYTRVNTQLITGNVYTDSCLVIKGVHEYMVRALKLEHSPSGSYFNLSEGISDTAFNALDIASIAAFTQTNTGISVSFNATSTLNPLCSWDFGDGQIASGPNPTNTYTSNGTYTVQLIATHPCYEDTAYTIVTIYEVGIAGIAYKNQAFEVFPNPSKGHVTITTGSAEHITLHLYTVEGKELLFKQHVASNTIVDLSELPKGFYLLKINTESRSELKKLVLE
ncbi:MAG: T9SS type A sorting domain-containing protein [Bacteroidia bacterium]|nr:T9SS type A sorting domain-containing protein [Bacteroidia bacterium]